MLIFLSAKSNWVTRSGYIHYRHLARALKLIFSYAVFHCTLKGRENICWKICVRKFVIVLEILIMCNSVPEWFLFAKLPYGFIAFIERSTVFSWRHIDVCSQ